MISPSRKTNRHQSAPAQEKQATQQKPRIFVGESNSWEIRGAGGSHASSSAAAAGTGADWIYAARGSSSSWSYIAGGARPQTAEVVKTFGERCPDVLVNNRPQVADYAVLFNHEGGKNVIAKRKPDGSVHVSASELEKPEPERQVTPGKDECPDQVP